MRLGLTTFFLSLLTSSLISRADDWSKYYTIEPVKVPETVDAQLGGLTTLPDGRLAATFETGEVSIYNPNTKTWKLFAQGLQCPLGLLGEEDGSILVMQWTELTRLTDTDGDGVADLYRTVFNNFGVSGNYHEFAYGPARDKEGNLYVSLNVASNNGPIGKNIRGPFTPIGVSREILTRLGEEEIKAKYKNDAGRMYSRVAYRGCVIKITPDGKSEPFAYGFRSPDGIGVDDQNRLWATDNQGDWRGTSPLYHVEEGKFYGHPASLVWKKDWDGRNPLDISVEELESMRTPAAGLFPHGELANSPTEPISTIDPSLFGLPKGELLIGEMNQPTLIRFLPEEVDGTLQGTMIPFLFTTDLGIGNHRLTFTEDGSLWIGKTHLGWAGAEGLARVKWKGDQTFLADKVQLLENGFEIHFNHPLGEEMPTLAVSRHTYLYHKDYGSPKIDLKDVSIDNVEISGDRRTIRLTLPEIEPRHLYTIELGGAADSKGNPLMGKILRYNVVKNIPGAKDSAGEVSAVVPEGFTDLLAKGDLSDWYAGNKNKWTLKNGVVSRGTEKTGSLLTKRKYKHFELRFDWRISEGGNSGVIYRAQKGRGIEYQVLDDERHVRGKEPLSSSAALYDIIPPAADKPYNPAGEWNSGRIVSNGNHIEHWLNGMKVLEIEIGSNEWDEAFRKSKYSKIENYAGEASSIQFQDHGADVSYRNILIREF
ncbi:family 16 glycoside hydrolase [Luteolibacter algae]|uniref:Family 16 glycoside hydrolase n=1 Tax=Luteolibacter algae TaxID=454151 RepID=A0ABW5D8B9_9BACT